MTVPDNENILPKNLISICPQFLQQENEGLRCALLISIPLQQKGRGPSLFGYRSFLGWACSLSLRDDSPLLRMGAVSVTVVIWFHRHWGSNHVCSGKGFPWNDGRGSRHTPLPSAAERLAGCEGQLCSLTRHKSGRGGVGPPVALPLQPGRRERQHAVWPLNMLTVYLLTPEVGIDLEKK